MEHGEFEGDLWSLEAISCRSWVACAAGEMQPWPGTHHPGLPQPREGKLMQPGLLCAAARSAAHASHDNFARHLLQGLKGNHLSDHLMIYPRLEYE